MPIECWGYWELNERVNVADVPSLNEAGSFSSKVASCDLPTWGRIAHPLYFCLAPFGSIAASTGN